MSCSNGPLRLHLLPLLVYSCLSQMLFSSNFLNDCHAHGFWQIDSCLVRLRAAECCRSNHVQRTWSLFLMARYRNLQVWFFNGFKHFAGIDWNEVTGTLITSDRENISFPLQQLYLDVCQTQKDNYSVFSNISHTENKSSSTPLFLKSAKCLCFRFATHFDSSPSSVLCLLFWWSGLALPQFKWEYLVITFCCFVCLCTYVLPNNLCKERLRLHPVRETSLKIRIRFGAADRKQILKTLETVVIMMQLCRFRLNFLPLCFDFVVSEGIISPRSREQTTQIISQAE